jgi:BirA family biotin operon repressor/biotin-[acetyl-CoA-carboxylase] ligase
MSTPSPQPVRRGGIHNLLGQRDVRVLDSCDSTNRVARLALEEGADVGLVVVSEVQTAGRGRLGRSWESSAGQNLLFSLVLQPRVPLERAASCVLSWAAAMAEVLDCRLKWPNDLQDKDGAKLGGILSELHSSEPEGTDSWCVILGVGLNVNQMDFPGLPDATSLRRVRQRSFDRSVLLRDLVRAIEEVDPGHPSALDLWRKRSNTLGRHVRIGQHEGLAESIRDDGALIVDGEPVLAGDVEFLSRTEGH